MAQHEAVARPANMPPAANMTAAAPVGFEREGTGGEFTIGLQVKRASRRETIYANIGGSATL
jgi:hypothetical protein